MILADTSIWIDHFRHADPELRKIIEDDRLLCHPGVIGEIELGSFRDEVPLLSFLRLSAKWLLQPTPKFYR